MGQVGAFETEDDATDAYSYRDVMAAQQLAEEKEFDLRIKMFALDMAVQALPTLSSSIDSEQTKMIILRRTAEEFERLLRGEAITG